MDFLGATKVCEVTAPNNKSSSLNKDRKYAQIKTTGRSDGATYPSNRNPSEGSY